MSCNKRTERRMRNELWKEEHRERVVAHQERLQVKRKSSSKRLKPTLFRRQ